MLRKRDLIFSPSATAAQSPMAPRVAAWTPQTIPLSHAHLGARKAAYIVAAPPPRHRNVTPGPHAAQAAGTPPGPYGAARVPLPSDAGSRVPLGHRGPHLGLPLTPELRLPSPSFPGGTRLPPPARLDRPQLRPSLVAPQRPCWFSCGGREHCKLRERPNLPPNVCCDVGSHTVCAPDCETACFWETSRCTPPRCVPGEIGCECFADRAAMDLCLARARPVGRPKVWCE